MIKIILLNLVLMCSVVGLVVQLDLVPQKPETEQVNAPYLHSQSPEDDKALTASDTNKDELNHVFGTYRAFVDMGSHEGAIRFELISGNYIDSERVSVTDQVGRDVDFFIEDSGNYVYPESVDEYSVVTIVVPDKSSSQYLNIDYLICNEFTDECKGNTYSELVKAHLEDDKESKGNKEDKDSVDMIEISIMYSYLVLMFLSCFIISLTPNVVPLYPDCLSLAVMKEKWRNGALLQLIAYTLIMGLSASAIGIIIWHLRLNSQSSLQSCINIALIGFSCSALCLLTQRKPYRYRDWYNKEWYKMKNIANKINGRIVVMVLGSLVAMLLVGTLFKGELDTTKPNKTEPISFETVSNGDELRAALLASKEKGELVLVDFYAKWCIACMLYEKNVFSDEAVKERMRDYRLLTIDLTESLEESKKVLKEFGVIALPAIDIYLPSGERKHRITGLVEAKEFLEHIK